MAEKPLICATPMVRAILDGSKTQTRRVLKPQPECVWGYGSDGTAHVRYLGDSDPDPWVKLPYQVGDRLWVKETWRTTYYDGPGCGREFGVEFAADPPIGKYPSPERRLYHGDMFLREGDSDCWKFWDKHCHAWQSPLFMPKRVARLWLVVTGVKVERLQDISPEDVAREGFTSREDLAAFWDTLYKPPYRWADNPWVEAVEFELEARNG